MLCSTRLTSCVMKHFKPLLKSHWMMGIMLSLQRVEALRPNNTGVLHTNRVPTSGPGNPPSCKRCCDRCDDDVWMMCLPCVSDCRERMTTNDNTTSDQMISGVTNNIQESGNPHPRNPSASMEPTSHHQPTHQARRLAAVEQHLTGLKELLRLREQRLEMSSDIMKLREKRISNLQDIVQEQRLSIDKLRAENAALKRREEEKGSWWNLRGKRENQKGESKQSIIEEQRKSLEMLMQTIGDQFEKIEKQRRTIGQMCEAIEEQRQINEVLRTENAAMKHGEVGKKIMAAFRRREEIISGSMKLNEDQSQTIKDQSQTITVQSQTIVQQRQTIEELRNLMEAKTGQSAAASSQQEEHQGEEERKKEERPNRGVMGHFRRIFNMRKERTTT